MDTRRRDAIPNSGHYKKRAFFWWMMYSKHLPWGNMKEYTPKQIKVLQANPYTFKVSKMKLYFTVKFKEDFWIRYQAGNAPRKIVQDLGYDLSMFSQKQIDSIVQRIKKEALSGNAFSEGENRNRRVSIKETSEEELSSPQSIERMQNELLYLRQEVEFLKKIIIADNSRKKD